MRQILRRPKMTAIDPVEEARMCILVIGCGRPAGDTYERMLWRVVERTGLTYSRAWKLLYRKVPEPKSREMDILRTARERQAALIKERAAHEKLDTDWARETGAFGRMFDDEGEAQTRGNHAAVQPMAAHPHSTGR
jgi:hypothetical protein